MRVLLTGGTGFLGKRVLSQLIESSAISQVLAVSRSKTSHPSSKVHVIHSDLSSPGFMNDLDQPVDAVIHLAGIYEFGASLQKNYENNVLGTLHLLESLKKFSPTRILFASSYAVGIGQAELAERRLETLPPKTHAYAYTKALAERLLESSSHSCDLFRLGILIGDTRDGAIDRKDGPYSFYQLMRRFQGSASLLPATLRLPVALPADPAAMLPLVAVDEAASVFIRSLLEPVPSDRVRYWGVFQKESTSVEQWWTDCSRHVFKSDSLLRPIFVPRSPRSAKQALQTLTGVASENFEYASWAPKLENDLFTSQFGQNALSSWSQLKDSFFRAGDSS